MSRAQPRRGDGEAPRRHFSFVLDLGCLRRGPRNNPGADSLKRAHSMCFIRWWSWGDRDRTKGREEEEVGGRVWDRQLWPSHLCVRSPDSLGAGKPFHQQGRGGKGRNIPSS